MGGRREERHGALLQQFHAQPSGYGLGWAVVGEDARQQDRFRGGLKPIIPATLMGGRDDKIRR